MRENDKRNVVFHLFFGMKKGDVQFDHLILLKSINFVSFKLSIDRLPGFSNPVYLLKTNCSSNLSTVISKN